MRAFWRERIAAPAVTRDFSRESRKFLHWRVRWQICRRWLLARRYIVRMPANIPHAVEGLEPTRMLLVMLRDNKSGRNLVTVSALIEAYVRTRPVMAGYNQP